MLEQEFKIDESCLSPDEILLKYLDREDLMKLYSRNEKLRDHIEELQRAFSKVISEAPNVKQKEIQGEFQLLQNDLKKFSCELLNVSEQRQENILEMKKMELSYRYAMEKFLTQLQKFLDSVTELRQSLKKTVLEFHGISRFTAQVTLASSATEFALLLGNLLHKAFDFNWNPKLFFLSTAVGGVSITASLFALSYMKQSTGEISRRIRYENKVFLDLIFLLRKGNWIDEEIGKLFPHGIDLKLMNERERRKIFSNKKEWRQLLCSTILLTNVQKDRKLLKDERFLDTVKSFVMSKTAEIWWHRMKLKKLLDGLLKKMDDVSSKEFIADHAVHYNRTALYLYSILIPWLLNSWNSAGLRVICCTTAAILAVNDLANNECEEFEEIKKLSQKFEDDFEEITEIYDALENDYE